MTNTRIEIPKEGIQWCKDKIHRYADGLKVIKSKGDARAEYHLMADGIVWSDEYCKELGVNENDFNRFFSVIVNMRTSLILGYEKRLIVSDLFDFLTIHCGSWVFCEKQRFDSSNVKLFENLRNAAWNRLDRALNKSACLNRSSKDF